MGYLFLLFENEQSALLGKSSRSSALCDLYIFLASPHKKSSTHSCAYLWALYYWSLEVRSDEIRLKSFTPTSATMDIYHSIRIYGCKC